MPITESHVRGTTDTPLIESTIGALFDETCARLAEREALVVRHQGIRWSFKELRQQVDALAAGFLALGLKPGDRVGIWSPNNAEWILTQFATAKAGLILVNINPAYRVGELEYALNKVGCAALVTAAAFKTSNYIDMLHELAPEIANAPPGHLTAARLPSLKILISIGTDEPGFIRFDAVPKLATDRSREQLKALGTELKNTDAVNIQFTSGTTGSPKGATLSHRNILNNAFFVGRTMGLTGNDRYCIQVPLYHCGGMVVGTLMCIVHGATMVLPSEWFDPLASLETMEAERCTGVGGVPTMFLGMLNHPEFSRFDLRSLRTGWAGGAPCPIEMMKRCLSDMHLRDFTNIFGMTETSPVCLQTATDDPIERKVGSVGRIHPHVEVKIVGSDGNTVPVGTPGEFCTRGYSVMLGYWNDPQKTSEAIDADGWMHTGDLGTFDQDGYGNVVGRSKDMAIRGGENIYPVEIENVLYQHPAVADAQVFGIPDERFGEELCAWIRLKQGSTMTETDARSFCRDRVAHFKIPRYIRFVGEFPTTVTGKIQKFVMRQRMIDELGLKVQKTA
ncbi:AMP-binding protein [Bradyrhizobium commune]|uniref:3-methylmercaptopropionyl-CoA ligase n=1 Tax=Bradyrhizobium commune TaxID=83627 RepID=A0A7S9D1V7_9BRAD|nr:AMP-binding protein [Bradyrhizobium commune]QPF88939.1 AMP-binding protein [Bradyrhizobium commune]